MTTAEAGKHIRKMIFDVTRPGLKESVAFLLFSYKILASAILLAFLKANDLSSVKKAKYS